MSQKNKKPIARLNVSVRSDNPFAFWTTNRSTHRSFRPYVVGIGQAAVSWNGLQEELLALFTVIFTRVGKANTRIAEAVWHSLESDRAQRKMLEAAAKRVLPKETADKEPIERNKAYLDRIHSLMVECDKLSDIRNDIIHSPLTSSTFKLAPELTNIRPEDRTGHPRAKKLAARTDLLAEFRWCRDCADKLATYCGKLAVKLVFEGKGPDVPLPDIPQLPAREPGSRRKAHRRTDHPK